MKNRVLQFIAAMLLFAAIDAKSQSVKEHFANSGVWADYGTPVSAATYPEFKGRLVNINWSDIELQPNVWDWTKFDDDISKHVADNMPVIFMVYTRMNAPQWLFSNGVPKVNETYADGADRGYSPYYLDEDYNFYFKRMITKVREHIQTLPPAMRNNIIGVQPCFGSTGDQIAYKGNVAAQYQITDTQFDSLFKVYTLYYYNEYKDLAPKITLLSNPDNWQPEQQYWLNDNCPGTWIKCGSLGKGFQLNDEIGKREWLYDVLNKPQGGDYIKSRSEIWAQQLDAGWWTKNEYKSMFALMTYLIDWGLDWHNETAAILQNPKHDSALNFFNKYAGQKVPGVATNAMCALKDVLDVADETRFPASTYGTVDKKNSTRYVNIYNDYAAYGAKLECQAVMTGSEYDYLFGSTGTNDVGWNLLPGNYERYLRQIDANVTSAGYWNIDEENNDAMYGRFGRGFDLAKGKDALYFDVEDAFLRNAPLNGQYPVTIEVTYYDEGNGSWRLVYDAIGSKNKYSVYVTCGNTKTWKKQTIVLTDAYFGNRSTRGSDFYIKSTGSNSSNLIFSVVELSRPEQSAVGFLTSALPAFDTVCLNSTPAPKSFVLNGAYLNGTDVKVGPFNGYTFSTSANGTYSSSLTYSNYGTQINSTIYVKINTGTEGSFAGKIPVAGGGVTAASVSVKGTVLNTSPILNADVVTISSYNRKDGSIDLQPTGGIGPFTYKWTNNVQQYWNTTTEDISALPVADYTVVVNSFAGCSATKTFSITQPDVLVVTVSQDSAIKCKGGTTTVKVTATGGNQPYTGTGTFTVTSGFKTYTVTDARGITKSQGYTVANGTIAAPLTQYITGPISATKNQAGLVYAVRTPNSTYQYTWTVPADAVITEGQNTSSITVTWGGSAGNVTVQAQNDCGSSAVAVKTVTVKTSFSQQTSSSMVTTTETSKTTNRQMTVMPNPVMDVATLQFYAEERFAYSIQIVDLTGKTLLVKKGTASPGVNIERLDVQKFVTGQYFIILINNKGEKQSLKLMKK